VLLWHVEDVSEVVSLASVGDWSKSVDACCHHSCSRWFVESVLPRWQSASARDAATGEVRRYISIGLTAGYYF